MLDGKWELICFNFTTTIIGPFLPRYPNEQVRNSDLYLQDKSTEREKVGFAHGFTAVTTDD